MVLLFPAQAHADDKGIVAWSLAGLELGGLATAGLVSSLETPGQPVPASRITLYALAPFGVAAGTLLISQKFHISPRPAHAFHGALWGGGIGLIFGTLRDNSPATSDLRLGSSATTLGILGALAGGTLGALVPAQGSNTPWKVSPWIGFGANLPITGIALLASPRSNPTRVILLSTGITTLLGFATGSVLAWAIPQNDKTATFPPLRWSGTW